ncbi:hypothetical protein [Tepidibacter formicigenes]|jgi:hypothetical protein|uniref:Sporulation related domain-containing protein n=1 Tax=Tepidibacter formicigenes DSM 15518 TaxID=1123349 RepID=A0A1M6K2L1_9FIRM|nr:hypothetical protein [Tepidibacter formicigenes]SHJ53092.1 hypothetical protein SAMN02744037_00264 [Tepidibacter formicigenes DSM 15518]
MNKIRKKKNVFIFILFVLVPLLACFTSKLIFLNLNRDKLINAVKIENNNKNIRYLDSFIIYSIQVGSLSDYEKVKLVKKDLDENLIPNYVLKKEGTYKIYSYTLLDENHIRNLLGGIKENYTDAFISKIKVSGINLEYTGKYSYMDDIYKELKLMNDNMKKESKFWYEYTMGTSKYENYINIINERKKIVDSLTKNIENIQDKNIENFKNKLSEFCEKYAKHIEEINENLGNNNMYSCEKLFLSGMFDYYNFINTLKNIN